MPNLLLGVLFAAVQPELGSLRPQPVPFVRILEPDGTISDLRVKTAGKAFALHLDPAATDSLVAIAFHPFRSWEQWRTDERGIAALQRDLGKGPAIFFVNRDGEAVFEASVRIDAATLASILESCALAPVSNANDYYSGPARLRARMDGIDAPLEFASVRCSNCHGVDGAGIPRGAIPAPNIRQPNAVERRSSSGARWSYDASGFCTALRKGVDGSGRILEPGMPRYDLTDSQCRMLWDYVTRLPGADPVSSGTSTMRQVSAPTRTTAHAK